MKFQPFTYPFPEWLGPYSPARGSRSGFRIKNGKLGAYMDEQDFYFVEPSDGVLSLSETVERYFYGGRVLFLPCGYVAKPLQEDYQSGQRVIIGKYDGGFKLKLPHSTYDFDPMTTDFSPGDIWHGPNSAIGLECIIRPDGALKTQLKTQTEYGSDEEYITISGANTELISSFKKIKPHGSGRVQVTIGGHVITKKEVKSTWVTYYIGKVSAKEFQNWNQWMKET